jgi:methionine S-methyltransferase
LSRIDEVLVTQSDFLKKCQQSSQEAYKAYKELLTKLEDPESRSSALEFAHQLADHLSQKLSPEQMNQRYHSSWINLSLRQGNGGTTQLKLLQLPSTFAPEEWSFTFFEGLARYKRGEFQDRTITELGCGIGWISIALAQQTYPQKIFGLDINPKAILCSKINLYINSFDHKGQSTWNSRGRTLNEVVEFHQSDLLEFCRTNKIAVDRVIGCIPQVLNPDPEFSHRVSARKTLEQANDEFLYSLSNYTADQGYIEDQFGLGLIARAVEESVDVLKISGKIVLNLGGRPGSSVLSHLFSRRGFNVRPIWQTQVTQAKDTDIRSLVRIEEKTRHRFEFYMGFGTSTSVSAKTALAYAEAGGEISHGLTVYEAQLRDPIHLPPILQFMRQPGHEEARKVIDLSYPEDSLALEKMSYLHALSEHLQDGSFFPYESTSGILRFRERLATYFNSYYHSPLTASHFLVAPARSSLIQNILSSFRPKRALVDSQLASQITSGAEIYETPRNLDLLCELLEKLRPEVAIYSISPSEAESRESFLRVCEVAENTGTRLFFDISELIELSSAPKSNGIFRHLADEALPAHVSLICGLVKNQLYRDLEVCFMISENSDLLEILESAAEL